MERTTIGAIHFQQANESRTGRKNEKLAKRQKFVNSAAGNYLETVIVFIAGAFQYAIDDGGNISILADSEEEKEKNERRRSSHLWV